MGFDLYLVDAADQDAGGGDYNLGDLSLLIYDLPYYRPDVDATLFPIFQQMHDPDNEAPFLPADIRAEVDRLDSLLRTIERPYFVPEAGLDDLDVDSVKYHPELLKPSAQLCASWFRIELVERQGCEGGCFVQPVPPCTLIAQEGSLVLVEASEESLKESSNWRDFFHVAARRFEWDTSAPPGECLPDLPQVPDWRGPVILIADGQIMRDLPPSFCYDCFHYVSAEYRPVTLAQVWQYEINELHRACSDAERIGLLIRSSC